MPQKTRPRPKQAGKARVVKGGKYRVLIEASPYGDLKALGRHRLDYWCMPQPPADKSGIRRLHAYASARTIASLRKAGRKVKVLADAATEGKRLQASISKGNRFRNGRIPPGVGTLV